ncbi:MAG: AAA family ATPase [Chitinophagaceae bacterium]|nr:MAG: AAA family ATPase [Chitinophagaceae bacterium]
MTEQELKFYLKQNFPQENEKCEWKEFKSLKHCVAGSEGDDIISYISSIANMNGGHLIAGVKDGTLDVIGIQDFHTYDVRNIKLKILNDCTNLASDGLEVQEYKTGDTQKIIWIFHIPRHQFRLPVYAHKKLWQRVNDSLTPITKSRLDAILNEVRSSEDWSAAIVPEATINDLDERAIQKARIEFKKRNPKYDVEADSWDDNKFLNKAKLTIKSKITRTALILLGKEEAEHFLGSFMKIRWNLKTLDNQDKDFEVFSIPFLLSVDEVYNKIRNLKYRYLREGTLFPDEVLRYEPFNIREPLHNAIAHQDYTQKGRINVVEFEDDHLVFSNCGSFLPKSVENVILKDTPEEVYRNPFLVDAMKNLDMIETQGGGIRKIFNFQRKRFFPLPDYDLSDEKVKVTITGKILDEEFARILIKNPDLSLEDILILDKVQKKKNISNEELKYLRKLKLIEGRKHNVYLSFKVVQPIQDEELKQQYIANRSFDDNHFKDMILEYLKLGKAKRKSINELVIPKLSAALTEEQKRNKVTNYLSSLKREEKIESLPGYYWQLT